METVAAYRNRFTAVKTGYGEEGYSGLRLAGLLMFGRAEMICDALPHYMAEYQERPAPKANKRWVDRLVPDGRWSGNLYDFLRKVY